MKLKFLIIWIGVICATTIVVTLIMMAIVNGYLLKHYEEWKLSEISLRECKCQYCNYYRRHNGGIPLTNQNAELDKIESFYDRRFMTLLWTMGVFVGLAGVLLPIVLAALQQQSFIDDKKKIDQMLKDGIEEKNRVRNMLNENDQKIKSLYLDFYKQNAQNYHGFAESWFRQYEEAGGVVVVGTAIVYCGIALKYNIQAKNSLGARSNVLMLVRIETCLNDSARAADKANVINNLKNFKWPISCSQLTACIEEDAQLSETNAQKTKTNFMRIVDTYGIPKLDEE